jgi:NAD(P)H dehydrogenase (quinone)
MSPAAYLKFQQEHNGDFLGQVIAGIYTKIRNGEFHVTSQYEEAAGRPHISWNNYFSSL